MYLTFNFLIIMYLIVISFGLVLLDVLWASCNWMLISLPRFGKFSAIYLIMLSVSFSHSFISGTPVMQILVCLMVFHYSCRFYSLFFILFSFCFSNWLISNDLSLSLLILLYDKVCFWNSLLNFFSSVIIFSAPGFLFDSLKNKYFNWF